MAVQTVYNPKENSVNVAVEPGQTIAFDFDLSTASFERTGNDLSIGLDDGGQVVLDNFFVTDGPAGLPPLQLADGTQVDSGDFLAAFDVDVTPAAAAAPGGGLNAYDDGAGSLIGGLSLSDSLGTFQWGGEIATGEEYDGVEALGAPGAPPGPPPGGPDTYLAVLYENHRDLEHRSSAPSFNINLPGASVGDTLNILSSANSYVDLGNLIYDGGKWTLSVSQDAFDAMKANGETLYDTIVVELNGQTYTIDVVLTQNGDFTSPPGYISEWYTDGETAGRYDEIHYQSGNGSPAEVWLGALLAENSHNNSVQTSENGNAASSIHVQDGVIASGANSGNTLITGQGVESLIEVGDNIKVVHGAENTLISGNISATASSGEGPVMSDGGVNALDAAFDVTLVSAKSSGYAYGVSANSGTAAGADAHNYITAGENIDISVTAGNSALDAFGMWATGSAAENHLSAGLTVTIVADSATGGSFAMYAADNGLNVITLTGGADGLTGGAVNLTGDVYATGGGQNIINGSAGDDAFTLNGSVLGTNALTINGGAGDDAFTLNGAVKSADALIIHGGDGNDTLVLMAGDSTEFLTNYGDWLEHGQIDGIESVTVELGSGLTSADYDAISSLLNGLGYNVDYLANSDFAFSSGLVLENLGTGHIIGGLGEQSINIDGLDDQSGNHSYSLSELAGSIQGFEHIDLGGGEANTLTIDSLLGLGIGGLTDNGQGLDDYNGLDLINSTVLRVTGDTGTDTIDLGIGWSSASTTVTYDNVTYDIYTNSQDNNQILLVQTGLL